MLFMDSKRKLYFTQLLILVGLLLLVGCGTNESNSLDNSSSVVPNAEEQTIVNSLNVGDVAPNFVLSDSKGNQVGLAEVLLDNDLVVLVFYFSDTWPPCISQLVGLEEDRGVYEENGAQIIAISVQSVEGAVSTAEKTSAQYPILADSDHSVSKAYGVTSVDLGLGSSNRSQGAVFIIDSDGQIVWQYLAKTLTDRVSSTRILENLPWW